MIVSFDKQFLFVHIPKTAGTSLSSVLAPFRSQKAELYYYKVKNRLYQNQWFNPLSLLNPSLKPKYDEFNFYNHTHLTAAAAQKIIPSKVFNTLFKFAIVRHPIDWQYSMYRHILAKHKDSQYRHIYEPVFKHQTFADYIRWRIDTDFIAPQLFQIVDLSGKIIVDKVYRFESLNSAFAEVSQRLNISAELPRMNQGKPIRENIDRHTKNLIFEHFKVDFTTFGYSQSSINPDWILRPQPHSDLASQLKKLKIEDNRFSLWSKVDT
ncbi:MAG: sulfotransferase family 2 domain-containing protein [Cyanobacteria bacterium P01_A01_bin.116]